MSIFDKWDKNVDTEGLQKDIAEAEANGGQGDYREVPVGTYEVKIDKTFTKEIKKHLGCDRKDVRLNGKKAIIFIK